MYLSLKEAQAIAERARTHAEMIDVPMNIAIVDAGGHLSYDEMTSFLASHGNAEALQIAHDLDAKVKSLLESAA